MAVSNTSNKRFLLAIVHLVRVHIPEVFARNLTPLLDAIIAPPTSNKRVDDAIRNLLRAMRLKRVLWKLPGRVSNLPEIKVQRPGLEIHSNNIRSMQRVVPVRGRRLNRVTTRRIAKHAIARHLDVESVLLAIAERVGQDPLDALAAARQAVYCVSLLGPDEALVVGVPVKLQTLLLQQVFGHGELHLEPVGRPAGPEGSADLGGCELVACGLFEERAGLVGRRVDGELDVVRVGAFDASFIELAGRC